MWNTPPEGPVPLRSRRRENCGRSCRLPDEEVIEQLRSIQTLKPAEQQAVQDVYFRPRQMLSQVRHAVRQFRRGRRTASSKNSDEEERWRYFQRQFRLCHARCRILADHLTEHVEAATRQQWPEGSEPPRCCCAHLYADENLATAELGERQRPCAVGDVAAAGGRRIRGAAGTCRHRPRR